MLQQVGELGAKRLTENSDAESSVTASQGGADAAGHAPGLALLLVLLRRDLSRRSVRNTRAPSLQSSRARLHSRLQLDFQLLQLVHSRVNLSLVSLLVLKEQGAVRDARVQPPPSEQSLRHRDAKRGAARAEPRERALSALTASPLACTDSCSSAVHAVVRAGYALAPRRFAARTAGTRTTPGSLSLSRQRTEGTREPPGLARTKAGRHSALRAEERRSEKLQRSSLNRGARETVLAFDLPSDRCDLSTVATLPASGLRRSCSSRRVV